MRKALCGPLVAALAIAGCGGGGADKNGDGKITGQEAAAESAEAAGSFPEPGLYKIAVDIEDMSYPGMPPGAAEQMKKAMSSSMAIEECLTEADRKDAVKQMAKGGGNGNCTYSKYDVSGGSIDAAMSCDMGNGGAATYTMKGTMSASGVDMRMEGGQQGGPGGGMHMKMHLKSQRVGACKA